jgi:predicted amidohydrolase
MRIGLAQLDAGCITPGDDKHFGEYAQKAYEAGCDLLVYPELSDSGYDLQYNQPISTGQIDSLQALARKYGLSLLVGCCIDEDQVLYNGSLYISKSGEIAASYRKHHLFRSGNVDEAGRFAAGERLTCIRTGAGCLGLAICFDLRYPRLFNAYAHAGVDILVTVAAWPLSRIDDWHVLLKARALENQCFTVGVNYCGKRQDITMGGQSMVCAPDGRVAAGASNTDILLTCDIDLSEIRRIRSSFPVFHPEQEQDYPCDMVCADLEDQIED